MPPWLISLLQEERETRNSGQFLNALHPRQFTHMTQGLYPCLSSFSD
jgi:hypothetical protein